MLIAIYHLIIIGVAVWAILTGYRRGFLRQIGNVVAVVVGIVVVMVFSAEFTPQVDGFVPGFISGFNRSFFVITLTSMLLFFFVYSILALVCIPIGKMMRVMPGNIINSIGGAVFKLFQWLLFISLAYNLLADLRPASDLTRSARLHDGNIIEGVIKLAPSIMGFPDAEEVGYRQQLEDAKKIS